MAFDEFVSTKCLSLMSSRLCSQNFAELCGNWCKLMINALNFLACAGWTESPICLSSFSIPSEAQTRTLEHCFSAAFHFLATESEFTPIGDLRSHLQTIRLGYQGETISIRRELICSKVLPAWPQKGTACLFPIVDYVHEELVDDLLNPARCLLPQDQWPAKTPKSKVFATDSEWYALVKQGAAIGLFGRVSKDELFHNQFGVPVLNGAMGVDKPKVIDGKTVNLLRFISNFVPINQYLRKLRGDSNLLPSVTQLSLVLLQDGELLGMESKDMESCFNLFYTPQEWAGYFAYEKQVPASAFGGSPDEWTYVYIRAVPMGCTFAVDLMQSMARRFVFGICGIPGETEMRKDSSFPQGDISVVCIDGFDFLRKLPLETFLGEGTLEETAEHRGFVSRCKALGLPLNAGKSLIRSLRGNILGGEIDGVRGSIQHARPKGHKLLLTTMALLTHKAPSQAALQHWAGVACFAAGFCRPVFSVLEEIFTFIGDPGWRGNRHRAGASPSRSSTRS